MSEEIGEKIGGIYVFSGTSDRAGSRRFSVEVKWVERLVLGIQGCKTDKGTVEKAARMVAAKKVTWSKAERSDLPNVVVQDVSDDELQEWFEPYEAEWRDAQLSKICDTTGVLKRTIWDRAEELVAERFHMRRLSQEEYDKAFDKAVSEVAGIPYRYVQSWSDDWGAIRGREVRLMRSVSVKMVVSAFTLKAAYEAGVRAYLNRTLGKYKHERSFPSIEIVGVDPALCEQYRDRWLLRRLESQCKKHGIDLDAIRSQLNQYVQQWLGGFRLGKAKREKLLKELVHIRVDSLLAHSSPKRRRKASREVME